MSSHKNDFSETQNNSLNKRKIRKSGISFNLKKIDPLSENQKSFYEDFKNYHFVLSGFAGTGKTYSALYLSLKELLSYKYEKIIICRSIVPTRDIGFLPGDIKEKTEIYEMPYSLIVNDLLNDKMAYETLKTSGKLEFVPTSFLRGLTFDNAIVIIDELQNCTYHEISTVTTRLGKDCKLVACGDFIQSDLPKLSDKKSILDYISIVSNLDSFKVINFHENDIVRSDFVKDFIIAENKFFKR